MKNKILSLIVNLNIFLLIFGGAIVNADTTKNNNEYKLIPRDILFGNPVKTSPKLSPDGKKMAYLAPSEEVLNVWVKTIGEDNDKMVTNDTNRGIRRYFWSEDSEYIFYLQDIGGDENWRLYSVDLKTDKIKDLTPFDNVQVRIEDHNKFHPQKMLIGMNKEDPKVHDVYNLHIKTGRITLVAKNPGNISSWVADIDLKVRGAMVSNPDGSSDLLLRKDEHSEWKKTISWGFDDTLSSGPVSFTKDGKSLYLFDSRNSDISALVKFEIETGNIEVIAKDSYYDIGNILINSDTYEVQAVSFTKERNEWLVLDENLKDDFENVSKLSEGDYFIYDRDNEDKNWLIGITVDNGPVSFYSYSRDKKKGELLFYNKPDLKNYEMSFMEPISFKSRDGLTIHGYITYPKGENRKKLPVVLNVHGGPWVRDTWGFDPESQWLADRGYACVQVNYRGSSGYGKKFLNAGNKEWGGKMHDDLVDTVDWLIKQGIAEPDKICIYGGSYGGYAALVGATFTPDVFSCAVSIVGPSNLITFIDTIPPYWSTFRSIMYKKVGNPETEEEFLKLRSPLFKVQNIKIPMLIAQGANDPRVNQDESEQIVAEMKRRNIEHEYLLFPDEGHGFAKPENRLKFFEAAEKFLAKHLGGRSE
ncbi:MAG: S9 family peptidase [Candidatus Omnitrophica bacterium]|nr:S9 family peptidase [Candidatus Omnitrophota bacterium]